MDMHWSGGGFVSAVKTEVIDGIEVGIVAGYIASFKLEDNFFPDKFQKGAFLESINDHKSRTGPDGKPRGIRMNFMHKRDPIGVFPIATVHEDERGLFGEGHINLQTQIGQEKFSLAKQGALIDFSIGWRASIDDMHFTETDDGRELRIISKAQIREGSLVDEPMNADAQVTSIKQDALTIEMLRTMSTREVEAFIANSGLFSRKVQGNLVTALKAVMRQDEDPAVLSPALESLNAMRAQLESRA